MAGYSPLNSYLDGNGIAATSGRDIQHITIVNNTIDDEPGGGIAIIHGNHILISNNEVYDNAHWSAYGASGISVANANNFDNDPGQNIVITHNVSINNRELVPEYRTGRITDGEGIILDTNPDYAGGFLVQDNTTYGNSGPGIEAYLSASAIITQNNAGGNLTNPDLASEGEIYINQSINAIVTNNSTTIPEPGTWTMLLIGFGGLCYMFHRHGRKHKMSLAAV